MKALYSIFKFAAIVLVSYFLSDYFAAEMVVDPEYILEGFKMPLQEIVSAVLYLLFFPTLYLVVND